MGKAHWMVLARIRPPIPRSLTTRPNQHRLSLRRRLTPRSLLSRSFERRRCVREVLKENENLWKQTEKLDSILGRAGEFDAIFFVGGHGPMFGLATSTTSHKLINEFASQNKIISAVCHGPAALAYVKTSSGSYLLDGHAVTGFSTSEEDAVGLTSAMPFILEDQLMLLVVGSLRRQVRIGVRRLWLVGK